MNGAEVLVFLLSVLHAVGTTTGRTLRQASDAISQPASDSEDILFFPQCGERAPYSGKNVHSRDRRIVGGTRSEQGSWPWQVALFFNNTHFCGGSLVTSEWVVTASHCFHDLYTSTNAADWSVTLGEHHLKDKETFEQVRGVKAIYLHPKYKSMFLEEIYDTPPDYDVALVHLSSMVQFDNYVYPICLLSSTMRFRWGKECFVTGWGHTQFNGTQPDILREAKLKLVPRWICNLANSYNGTIHRRALCAGFEEGGVDACQYDSGGPLACESDGRWYLTGIVSWGHECARPHKYGVYSNMYENRAWVEKTIQENSELHVVY